MKFEDLEFSNYYLGVRATASFKNGYGASVVKGTGTYGGDAGLYELGVLHYGSLCYDTPITDDVIGYLSPEEVSDLLAKIEALPKAN